MSATHLVCGGPHDEQFFVKKLNKAKISLGNRKRDKRQVEAAIEQASYHFLRDAYSQGDFHFWIALSQLPQWTAQLMD
jgi:hypothetical protein